MHNARNKQSHFSTFFHGIQLTPMKLTPSLYNFLNLAENIVWQFRARPALTKVLGSIPRIYFRRFTSTCSRKSKCFVGLYRHKQILGHTHVYT